MPEHEISAEMEFLANNWHSLTKDFPGWIAVRGTEIVGYGQDPAVLQEQMSEYPTEEVLYTYVPHTNEQRRIRLFPDTNGPQSTSGPQRLR